MKTIKKQEAELLLAKPIALHTTYVWYACRTEPPKIPRLE